MDKSLLKKQLQELTDSPGVYQYYDIDGKLLYVGKAKNLKKRVRSYFSSNLTPNARQSPRIRQMINKTFSLQTLVVENEKEALILENSFIKSQNPKYNILLRDDKTYPYIAINMNDKYPRFTITRKIIKDKNILYFGPYTRGAKEILNVLYELFPLVQESSCLRGKKSCLYFQISKCLGVCEFDTEQNQKDYKNLIKNAIYFMQNKNKMKKELESKMLDFAEKELFEQAKICRDCIEILKELDNFTAVDMKKLYNADIVSFIINDNRGIVLKLFVRDGKIISSHHVFVRPNIKFNNNTEIFKQSSEFELEIYTQALLKIVKEQTLGSEIILANILESNFKSIQESFSDITPKLIFPKRGDKLRLAELANKNALHLLNINNKISQKENEVIKQIAELFLMEQEIISIEVFDTSHHAGAYPVGGMISYINNEFCKENYRHYNLQTKDEYSQMREMLTRRALGFDKLDAPSLWLIDGGSAQINIALDIIQSSGASVEVIAISKEKREAKAYRAKGAARDILRSKNLKFTLEANDARLQFLQKLRDEAHRFAISFHRKKKSSGLIS